ncbi:hypothetical protein GOQ27_14355 [Clostridium sp. D2Q-11]|uniref:Uncharacterized protein n=1 Tax=Anaeromonas frigoriresistens TaxID=2683708 RepID=A0A942UW25_9FIRM|nr:NB-ARC domain-containing protein [Anaeromonas frigoriresistens]MBS4539653.1 hypothetical protein [Anaeromonas frigoriresistens]
MKLLKRNFINSIVKELEVLNGTEFEYFCRDILNIIIQDEVIHKGHNLFAKPVGYTRDFYEDDFSIVGQAGTDKDYFTNYDKPINDALKCIEKSQKCENIYLFSNLYCTGNHFNNLKSKIKDDKRFKNKKIYVYDAQRIGEVIFENLTHNKVDDILKYTPIASEIYKILPNNNKLPGYKNHYYSREEEQEIINQLEKVDLIQIYGLSGVGKTEISIKIASELKNSFDAILWISSDLQNNNIINFSSIRLDNYGQKVNIEYFIEKYSVLVIIDNLNNNVTNIKKQFKKINKNKSKLIITSLQKDLHESEVYKLDGVNKSISKRILNECYPNPIKNQLEKIINKVNGYPLVLNLIKNGINNDDFNWDDISSDIDDIHSIDDENNMKICTRLIGRYLDNYQKELSSLNYLNSTKIHVEFIKYLLSSIKVRNLTKRNIINDNNEYFTVHQLVMDSINALIDENKFEDSFDKKLVSFLKEKNIIKDINYYTFIWTHNNLIYNKYNNKNIKIDKKILLYAIIMSKDYFSEAKEIISKIETVNLDLNNYYDIAIYIEKCELDLLLTKKESKEEYELKAKEYINKLVNIEQTKELDLETKVLVFHHIGKIYKWINYLTEAKNYLLKTLDMNNEYYQSMLQLARIYVSKKELDESIDYFNIVLGSDNTSNVPITIVLSFYDLLHQKVCSDIKYKYIYKDINKFIKILLISLHSEFDQPYRIINKFARDLSYNFPEQFNILCENLPYPQYINENKTICKSYAEIFSSYYNMIKYNQIITKEEEKNEKMKEIFKISEKFFLRSDINKDYDRKLLMDLYIKAEEYELAKEYSEVFDDKSQPFYLQNMCKVERGLKNYEEALNYINQAIEKGKEKKVSGYFQSAFLHDKANTEFMMNDEECTNTLKEAIRMQRNMKTLSIWEEKLINWKSEFNIEK